MPETWVTPRVWVAGERVGQSKMNEISQDLRVLFPYTTAGDTAYRDPAGAYLTRLAKPSVDSIWAMGSSGLASWLARTDILNLATVNYNAGDQVISSTSYTDITNATLNIVTTKTSTIMMFAYGVFAVSGAGQRALIQAVISGTGSGDSGAPHTSNPYYIPFAINYYRTGIAAGTITCKLQARAFAGGNSGVFESGRIILVAF